MFDYIAESITLCPPMTLTIKNRPCSRNPLPTFPSNGPLVLNSAFGGCADDISSHRKATNSTNSHRTSQRSHGSATNWTTANQLNWAHSSWGLSSYQPTSQAHTNPALNSNWPPRWAASRQNSRTRTAEHRPPKRWTRLRCHVAKPTKSSTSCWSGMGSSSWLWLEWRA